MAIVDEVRSFNRFYTREIGLLNGHLPESDLSLAEARVLYEIARGEHATAADIARRLRMDKAHLSRIVGRFRARGWVRTRTSPEHRKRLLLSLTAKGQRAFASLDRGTRLQIESILAPLDHVEQGQLASAMQQIRSVLTGGATRADAVTFRGLAPGDLGWIIHRQALLYHREYGWNWIYEGLVAEILAKFVASYEPGREHAWIAERHHAVVGSVFLMKSDDPEVAKLRLLYVEPEARGLGIGRQLVSRCVEGARELGYRALTLWTNDVLVSARRIYEAAGFRLVDEAPHRSFGKDLIGQNWVLHLDGPRSTHEKMEAAARGRSRRE